MTLFQEDNIFGTRASLTYGPQLQLQRISYQSMNAMGSVQS